MLNLPLIVMRQAEQDDRRHGDDDRSVEQADEGRAPEIGPARGEPGKGSIGADTADDRQAHAGGRKWIGIFHGSLPEQALLPYDPAEAARFHHRALITVSYRSGARRLRCTWRWCGQ